MKFRSNTVAHLSELMLLTSIIGCGGSSEIKEQGKGESKSTSAVAQLKTGDPKENSAASTTYENSWVLRGQVVDQQGRPVADVGISTVWTANGVTFEELKRLQREAADDDKLDINEGRMEPWGHHPTTTDAHGNFAITMWSRDYKLLAMDKKRKRGALILIDPLKAPSSVKIELVPLVRLHGRVRIAKTGQEPGNVTVFVRLPLKFANRLAVCNSKKSRFEFWLPPGDYQLEALGHMTPPHSLSKFQSITLASGQRDVESAVLELTPTPPSYPDWISDAMAKGTWVDIEKRYGKPAPAWSITDARGVGKDVTISDFKGKWVLLYFWGPN